jgi:SsrA-binding protein
MLPMANIRNKKAFFDYEILDRLIAGISLLGPEVKSLRAGRGSLAGAFISIRNGEAYIKSFHIPKWEFSQENIDPLRDRKLLLKKREIVRLQKKLDEQGFTIVPLSVFFQNGYAKMEIALAKGKKQYDKRATIKKRDEERRIAGKLKK